MRSRPSPANDSAAAAPRRRRWLLAAACLVAVACLVFWQAWKAVRRPQLVDPPSMDLEHHPAAVAQLIGQARDQVQRTPRDADAWGKLGMVLFAHQFEAEPAACFAQAALLDPQEFRWPYLHALCIAPADREAAIRLYRRAVALRADVSVMHNRLGELLLELGRFDEAEAQLRAAQELDPAEFRPHVALARLACLRGAYLDALPWAERAVQLDPRQRAGHELLAAIHQRLDNREAARREQQVAARLPDTPLGWNDPVALQVVQYRRDAGWQLDQANSLLAQQRAGEAIRILRGALAADRRDPRIPCALARALLQTGRYQQAAEVLDAALPQHPSSAEIRFQRGVVYFFSQDYVQAEQRFRQAIELKSDYALAHYNLGHALERLGKQQEALECFQTTARYRPTHGGAHTHAGRILLQQGRPDEAQQHLELSVRFHPGDREAELLLRRAVRESGSPHAPAEK